MTTVAPTFESANYDNILKHIKMLKNQKNILKKIKHNYIKKNGRRKLQKL